MVHLMRIAVLLPAVLVAVSGCATQDWVRDLGRQRDARLAKGVLQRVDDQRRGNGFGHRLSLASGRHILSHIFDLKRERATP